MGLRGLLFSCLIFLSLTFAYASQSEYATVLVRVGAAKAETYENFVCATIDWWSPEKCDFGQCPWGLASALNLDLNNRTLFNAIKAFSPLRIRIGGSLQDQVVFETPGSGACRPFKKIEGALFGFSEGCLPRERWDELNLFFQKTGAVVTYGLNALSGRRLIGGNTWGGPWNSSNSRELINYTVSKGYPVDSWELGNELSGSGIGARVPAEQYARDAVELRAVVEQIYQPPRRRPLLVAPGGFFDKEWYTTFLQLTGPDVVDVVSHHIYNLGAGNDPKLVERILDNQHLDQVANTFRDLEQTLKRDGPWSSAWISEAGGSYTSGGRLISDTFVNGLWYLDQMGLAAKYNTKAYCRQSLMGGNYGLLDKESFTPNPDFYRLQNFFAHSPIVGDDYFKMSLLLLWFSALLWHRLMGEKVLDLDYSGSLSLRVHAHCAKHKAGVSLLLINLNKKTKFFVTVRNDLKDLVAEGSGIKRENAVVRGLKRAVSWVGRIASEASLRREEYHMMGDGDYRSKTMLLNGRRLQISADGEIPAMDPILIPLSSPVVVAPLSIVFAVFPNLDAKACE